MHEQVVVNPLENMGFLELDTIELEPADEFDSQRIAEQFIKDTYSAAEAIPEESVDADERVRRARKFLREYHYRDILADSEIDTTTLGSVLDAISHLEERIGGVSLAGTALVYAGSDKLEALYEQRSPGLRSMLRRAVETNAWDIETAETFYIRQAVEATVKPKYGDALSWRKNGEPIECEDFMLPIIKGPSFPMHCVDVAWAKASVKLDASSNSAAERRAHVSDVREAERQLLEDILGLPPEMVREFQAAISERTMLKDENHWTISLGEGGGIDGSNWKTIMRKFANRVEKLGRDQAIVLHKSFGITNLDRYSLPQLHRQLRLLDGDERLLRRLRTEDFSVGLVDSQGDHNNAFDDVGRDLPGEGIKLYFEVHQPSDIYRSLVMLKRRFGIMPSNLAIFTHGNIGSMSFNEGKNTFLVTVKRQTPRKFSIQQSSVGRFLRQYTRPSRRTGERSVVLFSCCQAATNESYGITQSTAETIVEQTQPKDRVVVSAAGQDTYGGAQRIQRAGFAFTGEAGRLLLAHQFRVATPSQLSRTGKRVAEKESPIVSGLR